VNTSRIAHKRVLAIVALVAGMIVLLLFSRRMLPPDSSSREATARACQDTAGTEFSNGANIRVGNQWQTCKNGRWVPLK
jgi:hypothetical protein